MPRVLESRPDAELIRLFHYDETSDQMVIETEQDVTSLVEQNRQEYEACTSLDRHGDMRRVASIPLSVFYDLKRRGITKDPKAFKAWLNDPDNRFFRTRPGVI